MSTQNETTAPKEGLALPLDELRGNYCLQIVSTAVEGGSIDQNLKPKYQDAVFERIEHAVQSLLAITDPEANNSTKLTDRSLSGETRGSLYELIGFAVGANLKAEAKLRIFSLESLLENTNISDSITSEAIVKLKARNIYETEGLAGTITRHLRELSDGPIHELSMEEVIQGCEGGAKTLLIGQDYYEFQMLYQCSEETARAAQKQGLSERLLGKLGLNAA